MCVCLHHQLITITKHILKMVNCRNVYMCVCTYILCVCLHHQLITITIMKYILNMVNCVEMYTWLTVCVCVFTSSTNHNYEIHFEYG